MKRVFPLAALMLSIAFLSACNIQHAAVGPIENSPVSIDVAGADRANIELDMSAGEMKVTGGANKLIEGSLEFNVPSMKPVVTTAHNGIHTVVTIRQPGDGSSFGKVHNLWDLQLTNNTLLDLTANCGAGQARLNLGEVSLRELSVHMGAGQLDLDLSGKPQHDYQVTIHGGVGQATVHLPHDVGIWASAHGGIGSINVEGLGKRGDHWENNLYDKAKVNVRIEVNGGIGQVRLIG